MKRALAAFTALVAIVATHAADWPGFLGPRGDGTSSETGIIAPWPKNGLRVVWHKPVGMGYGTPSIANGRLFLFDRHGNQARLTCMAAKTGTEH